jgi:preprotein translocase subunit SecG
MYTAITVIIILVCILLAFAVLIQNSKGGGLAAGFSAPQQIMGVRKTTDFLEKFTWGLATTLIVLCVVGNFVLPRNAGAEVKSSSIQEQIDNATMPASANAPLPGAQQQGKPAQQAQPAQQQPAQPAK